MMAQTTDIRTVLGSNASHGHERSPQLHQDHWPKHSLQQQHGLWSLGSFRLHHGLGQQDRPSMPPWPLGGSTGHGGFSRRFNPGNQPFFIFCLVHSVTAQSQGGHVAGQLVRGQGLSSRKLQAAAHYPADPPGQRHVPPLLQPSLHISHMSNSISTE